jgi:hypothetical protein
MLQRGATQSIRSAQPARLEEFGPARACLAPLERPCFPGRAAAFLAVLDADLARDHLMPESGDDRGRPGPSARSLLVSAGARSHGGSNTLLPVE